MHEWNYGEGTIIELKPPPLATRNALLQPSPTLAISAKAKRLAAAGKSIISFAAGEPDFNTPAPICDAAIAAIRAGQTKYTASSGIPELREAIAEKYNSGQGLSLGANQVIVSCGAKQSLFNAFQVLINPGDEVILLSPYWMTYRDQVQLAGGDPRIVKCPASEGFLPQIADIEAAIGPRTKAIVVNNPCNPTGAVYPRKLLEEIVALAVAKGLWIVADEIYEKLTYVQGHTSLLSLGSDAREITVLVNGCSKSYSMTGWRIGYAIAQQPIVQAMANVQDQVTSNPTSFAQYGALAAMSLPAQAVEEMRCAFESRRQLMLEGLRAVPGLNPNNPEGAFYVLAEAGAHIGTKFESDLELAEFLLDDAGVAVIPGSVFDCPGWLRFSYAASDSDIQTGTERVKACLS